MINIANTKLVKKVSRIFAVITIITIIMSCQSMGQKSFTIIDFKMLEKNQDAICFNRFRDSNNFSMWFMHSCYQTLNDSLYYITMSEKMDTLYIYNYCSYETRKLILNAIPTIAIRSIYYHNHDSVFIFYDREDVFDTQNEFDFILINRKGQLVNTYSLNDVPYVYKGEYYNMIFMSSDQAEENRIIDGNLILTFSIYSPRTASPDFIHFNPQMMCLYNLTEKTHKMLNVKFPAQDIGKQFSPYSSRSMFLLTYDREQNVILNFPYSPHLYRYDFQLDSLFMIDCKYDYTFENIDSTARVEGYDYMDTKFYKPKWSAENSCYFRRIDIVKYKNYDWARVIQVMDSNFNHIAYLVDNEHFYSPFFRNNQLISRSKIDELPYNIILSKELSKITWDKFESTHLKKKPTYKKSNTYTIQTYLKKLKIPKNSFVIILNLNYPCGNCVDFLMTKMNENKKTYQAQNIYYILYDNNAQGASSSILKRYHLTNCKQIKIDKGLLQKVYDKSELDSDYRLIEYGKEVIIHKCTFEQLVPLFDKKVKEKSKNVER
ncbi:MAG TPA: hypothetical protein PLF32_00430 [Bacteroidales bacterium]|nr:hypothetical protein [Bacteroidales bacterium]HOR81105.1 hypothetical protein [Bacteroidales bacterium]HPJ90773.1 hypothetical protein [Bacteroidales bacterium]HQB19967.1 hypothetical protein [Bacteroidales bacterium]